MMEFMFCGSRGSFIGHLFHPVVYSDWTDAGKSIVAKQVMDCMIIVIVCHFFYSVPLMFVVFSPFQGELSHGLSCTSIHMIAHAGVHMHIIQTWCRYLCFPAEIEVSVPCLK